MAASLKVFWNVEPEPLSVAETAAAAAAGRRADEPDLLLLPHAASSVASPTTTTSARERLRVAFTGDSSGASVRDGAISIDASDRKNEQVDRSSR